MQINWRMYFKIQFTRIINNSPSENNYKYWNFNIKSVTLNNSRANSCPTIK